MLCSNVPLVHCTIGALFQWHITALMFWRFAALRLCDNSALHQREMNTGNERRKRAVGLAVSRILRIFEERKRSRMKIFALFFMLGYGLVVGAFKIVNGLARLAWMLVMLLSRVVSDLVSGGHC